MRASLTDRNEADFGGRLVEFIMTLKPQDLIDYKHCYLTRDPLAFTAESRLDKKENAKPYPQLRNKGNAKLNFAINIHRLEQQMRTGKNENVRTIAKVKYALARYASFSSCWALTAYQDGEVYGRSHWIYPDILIYPDIRINGIRSERVEEESRMQKVIDDAINTINDDETAAEVQYLIGNLKTIAKKYPHTATAKFVSSHCDNWEDWI